MEIAAPGGGDGNYILSTLNNGTTTPATYVYAFFQGTSMAAPHVTGVVSLMVGLNPSLTPAQVSAIIQSTARAFPTGTGRDCTSNLAGVVGTTQYCGAGILNMSAALAMTSSRLLVPDGTSLQQAFTAFPETQWFAVDGGAGQVVRH